MKVEVTMCSALVLASKGSERREQGGQAPCPPLWAGRGRKDRWASWPKMAHGQPPPVLVLKTMTCDS